MQFCTQRCQKAKRFDSPIIKLGLRPLDILAQVFYNVKRDGALAWRGCVHRLTIEGKWIMLYDEARQAARALAVLRAKLR